VFAIIAVLLILLVFPSVPTLAFSEGTRARNESVPYGLVLVSLILTCLSWENCQKHKWMYFCYAFIVFWTFGHGERVEILGFLSYIALKIMRKIDFNKVRKKTEMHKKILVGITGVLVVMIAMWIGIKRTTSISTISLGLIFYNLLIQPTCGDVVYCFNCAANLWSIGEGLYGYTYLDYPLQLIPGISTKYSAAEILLDKCSTMGGALFYAESMMNFGLVGVILFNIEFFIVINIILKKRNAYRGWMWIPIVVEIFRICWYGRSGWILAAFIEIPILFIATKYFLNKLKISR